MDESKLNLYTAIVIGVINITALSFGKDCMNKHSDDKAKVTYVDIIYWMTLISLIANILLWLMSFKK